MQINVSIDQSQIDSVVAAIDEKLKGMEEKAKAALQDAGLLVETACKEECPVDTGLLRSSIAATQISDTEVEISPSASYASFVEFGTAAHEITPTNAKVLAFKSGGKMVFAKKVMHPGTPANPFMKRGIEKSRNDVVDYIRNALRE